MGSHKIAVNDRIGMLTVISEPSRDHKGALVHLVKCDCGIEFIVLRNNLMQGYPKACDACKGRVREQRRAERQLQELTNKEHKLKARQSRIDTMIGQKFGKLTLLEIGFAGSIGQNSDRACKILCECGDTENARLSYVLDGSKWCCKKCSQVYNQGRNLKTWKIMNGLANTRHSQYDHGAR